MKKRAVAYIRVSTASSAQLHSYEFQEQYWQDRFEGDPNVELTGIYADRGISGSSIHKRPQFLVMMEDARQHKFDVIYVKSVSRFARNTVQLLEAVRELRDIGIEVIFENENISTFQPTSEIFLTIAATVAENDLQVDSDRMRWSIRHRYENGWISIGSKIYGYRMTKDNTLEIVPEEAAVIRRIYEMYVGGAGCCAIADTLNDEGYRASGGNIWQHQVILAILTNEKYMGDAMMGKSVYHLGIKHNNMDGTYGKRYYMEDTHEGIVSKELWYKAQEVRVQRTNKKTVGVPRPIYALTSLIECGQCGTHFQHKVNNSGKKWASDIWVCGAKLRYGVKRCDCTSIKDSVLKEKFVEAYNEFVTKRPQGESAIILQRAIERLKREERELYELRMQRLIPESAFREEQKRIKAQIAELNRRYAEQRTKTVRESDFTLITEYSDEKVEKFITRIKIHKGMVTFTFYNGVEISRKYSNGQPGNKVGWNKKEA